MVSLKKIGVVWVPADDADFVTPISGNILFNRLSLYQGCAEYADIRLITVVICDICENE